MKKSLYALGALALLGAAPAYAHTETYNVTLTFHEPDTQPRDTIFNGTFDFDPHTLTVSNLHGMLSESMTGDPFNAGPNGDYGMTWLNLTHQLSSTAVTLGGVDGLLVTTFLNSNTNTFSTMFGGDGWTPAAGVGAGGVYYGFPTPANNPGNAYTMIFVPTADPTMALAQAQIDKLAYADCAPGGMMGAVCMTGTSVAGYGSIGTMSGFPISQTITSAAPVPEPETYAMMLAGLGLLGFNARRRRQAAD